MQTFLPYQDFKMSARVLDRQRLGKQRVEAKQILLALRDPRYGWQRHPAVLMWQGHKCELAAYGAAICCEWRARDYLDSLLPFFQEAMAAERPAGMPWWLGQRGFHLSHQSNLIRKLPDYYSKIWPDVPADLPYIWPSLKEAA